ncbi:MAG: glycosyl hydrolase family 8 [candidate division Zixibacteria bacterium]|nr:glycosyl hydrolase family 8 [candidate division Zixibacteria bacterium]MCI0695500.1 glycosyl hydrolase family 8 [candidate division KSB1 bacterium]
MTAQAAARTREPSQSKDGYIRQLDELSAAWSFYKHKYIDNGRVISLDENGITTSEGQGYAMLRSVWSNDRSTFNSVWNWTRQNLQVREDKLFAWKWKGRILSAHAATDADTDIALALILAARRFSEPAFQKEALEILDSIWNKEILKIGRRFYVTAGDWAAQEEYPTIHVAYLAPYAYELFASVDSRHPWKLLVDSSYEILHWIYFEKKLPLPPEIIFIDKQTGQLYLQHPQTGTSSLFSYDAFPIFWRVALDASWFGRGERPLRRQMLAFFQTEWKAKRKFLDRYSLSGQPLSKYEGLPLYCSVQSLALSEDRELAAQIGEEKISALLTKALAGKDTPYYLHNWLWFGRALELNILLTFDEFLGFLRPFDFDGFAAHFPWVAFFLTIGLFFVSRFSRTLKIAFLIAAFYLCARYLLWRAFNTLNFVETLGPFISISLWAAECYSFSTVLLLLVQVGLGGKRQQPLRAEKAPDFSPSVDIFIPIYTESCEILEKTLIGARAIRYANKRIYVLDDSHREEVAKLAARHGASYIKGPRKHAKAGNLNHALALTWGELIVVFDTDHIPMNTFLEETVPLFADPQLGFVQTPHHFYNQDIFQRAFGASAKVPNELDMFNHAIQVGRHPWNGAFFAGSGAVFRRAAITAVNGFNLMSITEDIHTSQHLHGAGWRSAFVDQDLAVGLAAEDLSSYIVQRRRWMLGCLQIFFKDNPLFRKGLTIRQRLGYFASLYYFFFPVVRVIFWATPLYFLLFHLHPIFSEVSILVAYLLPNLVIFSLIDSVVLPRWPRMLWGTLYETTVSFPLFRSLLDLLLPRQLGFKVTPKGIVSEKRAFNLSAAKGLLMATAINVIAIAKGLIEFFYLGIEKDAYFFNLGRASFNLLFLLAGILIAWEKPQRRANDRIKKSVSFKLKSGDFFLKGVTHDLSLSGVSFLTKKPMEIPHWGEITMSDQYPITCACRLVYYERISNSSARCGLEFVDLTAENRARLVLNLFSSPDTWKGAHDGRTRSNILMAVHFLVGAVRCLLPSKNRTRKNLRKRKMRPLQVKVSHRRFRVLLKDFSWRGFGVLYFGKEAPDETIWIIADEHHKKMQCLQVYRMKLMPYVWRVGLRIEPDAVPTSVTRVAASVHSDFYRREQV